MLCNKRPGQGWSYVAFTALSSCFRSFAQLAAMSGLAHDDPSQTQARQIYHLDLTMSLIGPSRFLALHTLKAEQTSFQLPHLVPQCQPHNCMLVVSHQCCLFPAGQVRGCHVVPSLAPGPHLKIFNHQDYPFRKLEISAGSPPLCWISGHA